MEAYREKLVAETKPEESDMTDEEYGDQEDYLIAVGKMEPRDSSEALDEQIL